MGLHDRGSRVPEPVMRKAFEIMGSYMNGDAGRVRTTLVEEYRGHHAFWCSNGVEGFAEFLHDRNSDDLYGGTGSGPYNEWGEAVPAAASSNLPICDSCLQDRGMNYYDWLDTEMETWAGGRPLMEAGEAQFYPATDPNLPHEKHRVITLPYTCPVEAHDDGHEEHFFMDEKEIDDFLSGSDLIDTELAQMLGYARGDE